LFISSCHFIYSGWRVCLHIGHVYKEPSTRGIVCIFSLDCWSSMPCISFSDSSFTGFVVSSTIGSLLFVFSFKEVSFPFFNGSTSFPYILSHPIGCPIAIVSLIGDKTSSKAASSKQ